MRIVYLAAGAGRMYCGGCLHSNTLAAALIKAGRDVTLVPLYTPIRTDEDGAGIDRVALGGLNVYLNHASALFRHVPGRLSRVLDSPALLRWLGRFSSSTRPEQLGGLTVSMLRGEEGSQRSQLQSLVDWLRCDLRPDLVHLSTVLLAGLARPLARGLGVPVVCTLTGEDAFLDRLPEPYRSEARQVLTDRVRDVTALVALNNYYAHFMAGYLSVPRSRVRVVQHGLNLEGHAAPGGQGFSRPDDRRSRPFTVGFLGRVCKEKGLHLVAEAVALLSHDPQLPSLRLLAGGYIDRADRAYLEQVRATLRRAGAADRFQYVGEMDRAAKIAFLQSLDVISLPAMHPEPKGIPALEAWANGVPAVLPADGAFPEMIEQTNGGITFEPRSAEDLARAIRRMLLEPGLAARCGRQGQAAVHERYHAARMAEEMFAVYSAVQTQCPT